MLWTPKYRKWISRDDIRERARNIFEEVSRNHDFEIDKLEIAEDHVHIFLSFPPRYNILFPSFQNLNIIIVFFGKILTFMFLHDIVTTNIANIRF